MIRMEKPTGQIRVNIIQLTRERLHLKLIQIAVSLKKKIKIYAHETAISMLIRA